MVELGHVALRVRDLDQAIAFYRDVVGLSVVGRLAGGRAAVLSGGRQHHELLLVSSPALPALPAQGPGARQPLYHVAWKVGEGRDALIQVGERLRSMGIQIDGAVDHSVSFSLYLRDPEGNQVELFTDNPEVDWRSSAAWLEASSAPIAI